jgi:hypothetical protein
VDSPLFKSFLENRKSRDSTVELKEDVELCDDSGNPSTLKLDDSAVELEDVGGEVPADVKDPDDSGNPSPVKRQKKM